MCSNSVIPRKLSEQKVIISVGKECNFSGKIEVMDMISEGTSFLKMVKEDKAALTQGYSLCRD